MPWPHSPPAGQRVAMAQFRANERFPMMSDTRIASYFIRSAVRAFANPRSRRDVAALLRRVRVENGRKAARLVLATLSAECLTQTNCPAVTLD